MRNVDCNPGLKLVKGTEQRAAKSGVGWLGGGERSKLMLCNSTKGSGGGRRERGNRVAAAGFARRKRHGVGLAGTAGKTGRRKQESNSVCFRIVRAAVCDLGEINCFSCDLRKEVPSG
ncbi:hypothetical protein GWI33_005804 [Rhynchophorus ferrugineus]|uniref:Uncharacterized protein n=1 Tax=Rhynchophorus ferrugineus TaxID=354439 RepID=A0A834IJH5_RHYFE|nr:hypothetical protein GWI33_005804 [Rhynchophorus ferrugineus]